MSIVNDIIPEDAEMFRVSLTLDPDDRNRLGSRVTVSPDEATVTIEDNNGRQSLGLNYHILSSNTTAIPLIDQQEQLSPVIE